MTALRHATPADAARITQIYNDAVTHTVAIWNDALTDEAQRSFDMDVPEESA